MKVNSIKQQNLSSKNQNFKGLGSAIAGQLAKHPVAIAGLATSSVVAQKIVMSGSEATIGPVMDILTGKTITKITNEKDGRTNQSSKTQAIRTCAQSIGGTITGVIIRTLCIFGSTLALSKAGGDIGKMIALGVKNPENQYQLAQQTAAWGKSLGGAIAILVMMFTNFLIDAPFINKINKEMTHAVDKFSSKKQAQTQKEVK